MDESRRKGFLVKSMRAEYGVERKGGGKVRGARNAEPTRPMMVTY